MEDEGANGIWGNETNIWISAKPLEIHAYKNMFTDEPLLENTNKTVNVFGIPDTSKDFISPGWFGGGFSDPNGLWGDGETMWVLSSL